MFSDVEDDTFPFPFPFAYSLTVEYVLIFQGPLPSCDEYGTVEGNGSTTYDLDL